MAFKRIIERFRDTGHTRPRTPPGPVQTRSGDIARVKQYFENNSMKQLRKASRDLGMSKTTIWRILRVDLKWKSYKPSIGQVLTEADKARRLTACQWFLNQSEDFFEKQVIFSDEKYFVLQQGPNKQNDQTWAPINPHIFEACKIQGGKKAMCWTGLVDGKVLGPFWLEGSMDAGVYRELLEDFVWPAVRGFASRKQVWFMQDGATPHTVYVSNFRLIVHPLLIDFGGGSCSCCSCCCSSSCCCCYCSCCDRGNTKSTPRQDLA